MSDTELFQLIYQSLRDPDVPVHVRMADPATLRKTARVVAETIRRNTPRPQQATPSIVSIAALKYE